MLSNDRITQKQLYHRQTYDRDANSKVHYSYKVKQKDAEVYVPFEFDDRFEMNVETGEFKFNENHRVPGDKSLYGKYEVEVEVGFFVCLS